MSSTVVPISAEFARQLAGDGDACDDVVTGADGVPMLMLAARTKKLKKGKGGGQPAGASGGGAGRAAAAALGPLSRAERRKLKSQQRKIAGLEVRMRTCVRARLWACRQAHGKARVPPNCACL
jgi:hypothetical protein